jgi:micrococcal nuclease
VGALWHTRIRRNNQKCQGGCGLNNWGQNQHHLDSWCNRIHAIQIVRLIFLALLLSSAHAAPVISISDGDTLTVLNEGKPLKIRLANIDAPEKRQAFGQRSRQSLSELCFGKDATYSVQNIDRYGRTVAVVMCASVEANRTQVERGMAWVYTRYNKDKTLPEAQERAKQAGWGLWADKEPVPPWEWRKSNK